LLFVRLSFSNAGYAFRHSSASMMDKLRVPLKAIQDRIGHALTGNFTLDVYGHMLDWTGNDDAAKRLGEKIAKAVAEIERKQRNLDSGHLTAHKKRKLSSR